MLLTQWWSSQTTIGRRVEIAFFCVSVALGLTLQLRQWFDLPYWFPFLVAGIASAWIGGSVAGWTAVLLSSLASDYFFSRPYYSMAINPDELPHFIAFTLSMLAGNWFGTWRKHRDFAMRQAHDALASKLQEGGVELAKVSKALRAEVSSREHAEYERRIAELRWRAVFDNSVVGMALADEGGHIIASNQRYLELIETGQPRLLAPGLDEYLPALLRPDFNTKLAEMIEGRRQRIETEIQRPSVQGTAMWLRIHIALVPGTQEFPRFFIAFCEDTSERRRTEEELLAARTNLAHASRLTTVGELTASIAHELNQPLAAIVTNGNACLRWLGSDPPNLREAGNTLNWIMRDARRTSDIIAHIRTLIRKGEPQWGDVNFNEIVYEGLEMMRGELASREVEVSTWLEPLLPTIHGERVQLQQVFLNLTLNAIEAMASITSRSRQLMIRSTRQNGERAGIMVEVNDSGPGVDAANIDKLFSAFFSTKAAGTGLGLWICQSIVESHSGQLLAAHNQPCGMSFRLLLPCEPAPAHDMSSIAGEDFAV